MSNKVQLVPGINTYISSSLADQSFSAGDMSISNHSIKVSVGAREGSFISVTQFATEAGISGQAVRKMIAEKRITAARNGKQHTIPREELEEYLRRRAW